MKDIYLSAPQIAKLMYWNTRTIKQYLDRAEFDKYRKVSASGRRITIRWTKETRQLLENLLSSRNRKQKKLFT